MEGGAVLYLTLGVGAVGVLGFLFNLYVKATRGVCTCKTDLTGKTILITGPTAGIGVCTSFDMARRNARVILACRNTTKGSDLKRRLVTETGNNKIEVYELDVSSMKSVRNFVTRFTAENSKCDILINNAGVPGSFSRKTTEEGLELTFATNYFGPFLLTNLLLDTLKRSSPSRIVNVSSVAHIWGKVDLDDLQTERGYNMGVYNGSKLAIIMFTRQLSARLKGTGVTANSLHPGSINTGFFQKMPGPLRVVLYSLAYFFFKTPEEGAQTTIYCAVAPELEGVTGKYFSDCAPVAESKKALDDDLALRLWNKTEEITGLKK